MVLPAIYSPPYAAAKCTSYSKLGNTSSVKADPKLHMAPAWATAQAISWDLKFQTQKAIDDENLPKILVCPGNRTFDEKSQSLWIAWEKLHCKNQLTFYFLTVSYLKNNKVAQLHEFNFTLLSLLHESQLGTKKAWQRHSSFFGPTWLMTFNILKRYKCNPRKTAFNKSKANISLNEQNKLLPEAEDPNQKFFVKLNNRQIFPCWKSPSWHVRVAKSFHQCL